MAQLHFYQEPIPLDKVKHANLKFSRGLGFGFANNVNAVPVSGFEFFKCSRHFPVVFIKNAEKGYIPLALLSLKKDSHDYGESWEDVYVPNYIRRYPFVLSEDNLVIIDKQAPHFSEEQGEPLFKEDGEASDALKGTVNFLEQSVANYKATDEFISKLIEKDMLQKFTPTVKIGESNVNFGEMYMVDERKLVELSESEVSHWLKSGWIAWAYAHLHSLDAMNIIAKAFIKNGVPEDMLNQKKEAEVAPEASESQE